MLSACFTGPLRGESSHKWPVIAIFIGLFFYVVSLGKLLNKRSSCRWFHTPWHTCDATLMVFGAPVVAIRSLPILHISTALLWCHVQNYVMIDQLVPGLVQNEISIEFGFAVGKSLNSPQTTTNQNRTRQMWTNWTPFLRGTFWCYRPDYEYEL